MTMTSLKSQFINVMQLLVAHRFIGNNCVFEIHIVVVAKSVHIVRKTKILMKYWMFEKSAF